MNQFLPIHLFFLPIYVEEKIPSALYKTMDNTFCANILSSDSPVFLPIRKVIKFVGGDIGG